MSGRETYNVVTDVAVGPNVRLWDNLIQAAVIFLALLIGAGVGALVIDDPLAGALVGGFGGLIVGLLASGIFLMIYRAARHARGKHD
jgi:hypothetical protein